MKWLRKAFLRLRSRPQTLRGNPFTMAYTCNGRTNTDMVNRLKAEGLFSDPRVESALLSVDRGDFTNATPYRDSPMSIGYNATISAPHMHATALQNLKDHLVEGSRALDVGSGSGYLTACMAAMVGVTGKVIGIEHIPQLVQMGKDNIAKHHKDYLTTGRVEMVEGDGRLGYPIEGGYNAIHVGAAAPTLPEELLQQMADGGRMVIPVGSTHQTFYQVDRVGNDFRKTSLHGVIYVPLTTRDKQLRGDRS